MMRRLLCIAAITVFPSGGSAQQAASAPPMATDSLYLRAQRLVNEGKGAEGRAVVDSLFSAAMPGTPAQAEALFWRATLATTAAEAERDYRQITVEHPLSRRAEDALLRLAQLELQRGERTLALAHLERLLREHGSGSARARAAYWSARVYFEMNDSPRACRSLADARLSVATGDVELRNQIEYATQRCPASVLATTAVTPVPATAPPAAAPPVSPPVAAPSLPTRPVPVRDSASTPPSTSPARDTSVVAATPVTSVADSAKAPAVVPPAAKVPAPVTSPRGDATSVETQRFSVQVAAYQTKAEADRLVKKYRANGYDARAFGTVAPFRVRIGRFRTRAEAVELAKVLKAKSGAAFVVVAETR